MARTRDPTPQNPRKTAAVEARFPSLGLWRDPWEDTVTLGKLRGKADSFETLAKLVELDERSDPLPFVSNSAIVELLASAAITEQQRGALASDLSLIAQWHFLPEFRARYRLGHAEHLRELEKARKLALRLHVVLGAFAFQFQGLVQDAVDDDLDLMGLANDVHRFANMADEVREVTKRRRGRQQDNRRNQLLAMVVEAVEAASGQRVAVSRGNKARSGVHFSGPTGHVVAAFMRLLGFPHESTLASVLEALRRRIPSI